MIDIARLLTTAVSGLSPAEKAMRTRVLNILAADGRGSGLGVDPVRSDPAKAKHSFAVSEVASPYARNKPRVSIRPEIGRVAFTRHVCDAPARSVHNPRDNAYAAVEIKPRSPHLPPKPVDAAAAVAEYLAKGGEVTTFKAQEFDRKVAAIMAAQQRKADMMAAIAAYCAAPPKPVPAPAPRRSRTVQATELGTMLAAIRAR